MSITIETGDAVLRIAFNRPEKKNALTTSMYAAMTQALQDAEQNTHLRAIYFHGAPKIFTAGNDLEDFLREPRLSEEAPAFQFLLAMSRCSLPIVASVQGAAVGIGTTLLLHCDLVYAAKDANFCMPFTSLGLCPEAASSLLFPQLAGYQRAAEKLLLGEWFDAFEAQQIGLVNKVLSTEEIDVYSQNQLNKLTALPPEAIRTTKRLLRSNQAAQIQQRLYDEAELFRELLVAPEASEAFSAFFEKRKPNFPDASN